MNRRSFVQAGLIAAGNSLASIRSLPAYDTHTDIDPVVENGIAWYNVEDWGLEGKGWTDCKRYYDRLPAKAEGKVRNAVWGLSRHSAGMMARFASGSDSIHVRYQLYSKNLSMSHMPATGVSGVDLYGDDGKGEMRWINVSRPNSQTVKSQLASGLDSLPNKAARVFQLYLPLYNGVEKLEIGVSAKSEFRPISPRTENRILFYGTSIMHGACASRPGMCISSIVGRRLNASVINLGFSGNGKMETEVGSLICELNPSIIAVDCLPNMNAKLVKERAEKLVLQLRDKLPKSEILLVEDRSFTNSTFFKSRRDHHAGSRRELRAAYKRLMDAGVKGIHYLPGESLLGKMVKPQLTGLTPMIWGWFGTLMLMKKR